VFQFYQRFACVNEISICDIDLHDLAVKLRLNHQFHLHGLHGDDRLALLRHISCLLVQFGDGARHWRFAETVSGSFLFNCTKLIRLESET